MIRITVNGEALDLTPAPQRSLLSALRDELGLTAAKPGCGEGECGACTVLFDGTPVHSCRTWLADADGRVITTLEGLAADGRLHPLQAAFLDEGAFQCGYCTAGMILSAEALLERDPDPDELRIRTGLAGTVCRCGTYARIVRAVRRAAELGRDAGAGAGAAPPAGPGPLAILDGRPRRPWDLIPPAKRDWFSVLPEGLVVFLETRRGARLGGWGGPAATEGGWLHVGADGVVHAFRGKVDVGQDTRTALSLRVAEEFGVALPAVRLVMGDTDLTPWDMGTFGSMSMPVAA